MPNFKTVEEAAAYYGVSPDKIEIGGEQGIAAPPKKAGFGSQILPALAAFGSGAVS